MIEAFKNHKFVIGDLVITRAHQLKGVIVARMLIETNSRGFAVAYLVAGLQGPGAVCQMFQDELHEFVPGGV